jgi:hypothetical protein
MFVNRTQYDTSTNYHAHQRNQAKKKEDQDDKIKVDYSKDDTHFMDLVKSVVLGTYTVFNYDPTEQECKQLYARMYHVSVTSLEEKTLDPEVMDEMKARLVEAEKSMLYTARHCKGDASETGLVQFCQPLLDLNETRAANDVQKYKTSSGKEI